jgi:hypothetical protein
MAIDSALQALINADPIYQQQIADAQAQAIADKSSRDTAMKRGLVDFGQTLDSTAIAAQLGISAEDAASIMDAQTNTLAQQNTQAGTSTAAQLQRAYQDAQRGVVNALASRGMLRSGDTGYSLGREGQADVQRQYGARKQFLDYLAGLQSGYTEAEKARQQANAQALSDVYTRILQQNPNGIPGTGGTGGDGDTTPPGGTGGGPSDPGGPQYPTPYPTTPPAPTTPGDSGGAGTGYTPPPVITAPAPAPPPIPPVYIPPQQDPTHPTVPTPTPSPYPYPYPPSGPQDPTHPPGFAYPRNPVSTWPYR